MCLQFFGAPPRGDWTNLAFWFVLVAPSRHSMDFSILLSILAFHHVIQWIAHLRALLFLGVLHLATMPAPFPSVSCVRQRGESVAQNHPPLDRRFLRSQCLLSYPSYP